MPYLKYSLEWWIRLYWEVPSEERVCEVDDAATSTSCVDDGNAASMSGDKGETSSSSHKTKYEKLPHSPKYCLDYCTLLCYINDRSMMEKERVVRLMVAEGLIEDKAEETDASSLEDIASSFIDELVSLGMLIQRYNYASAFNENVLALHVPEPHRRLCVVDGNKKDFDARNVDSPIRMRTYAYKDTKISHHLKNLPIQSLFFVLFPFYNELSQATMDTIFGLRFLLVLALRGFPIDILLNEVREHVNLRFSSLNFHGSRKILPTLGNLPRLQTLECTHSYAVPEKVSRIKILRHLPTVDARCDNIGGLSSLTQLQSLGVHFVADENIDELLEPS